MSPETRPLKVPISQAAEHGVSWLNDVAEKRRVVLTRFGRPGAVVDSAERLDETARTVTETQREVVAVLAEVAAGRTTGHRLDEVCEKLNIDVERVHQRAAELRR